MTVALFDGAAVINKVVVPPLAASVPLKLQVTNVPPPLAAVAQVQPVPLLLTNAMLTGSWSSKRAA